MQSIAIVILGIIGMMFGWFVYSKFIANRIFKLDDSFVTPAHTMQDLSLIHISEPRDRG